MGDDNELDCLVFNQDGSCLAVGHKNGCDFYHIDKCGRPDFCEVKRNNYSQVHIAERLLLTGLALVVSRENPRTLNVCHLTNKNTFHEQRFSSSILCVKLNRERVVVCLEESIHIYGLTDMKKLHTIEDTPTNKTGLIDLSTKNSILAYPGSSTTGKIHIFDAFNHKSLHCFVAHESPLAAIKFDQEGHKLATASTKGTVIRVFSVKQDNPHSKLFEFRRGVASVTIYSLGFNEDSTLLVSTSNTETVHIFKLLTPEEQKAEQEAAASSGWYGYLSGMLTSQMMEKSFATARLPPATHGKTLAVLPKLDNKTKLAVATDDGFVYVYNIPKEGGECDLLTQSQVGPTAEDANGRVGAGDEKPPSQHRA